MSFRPQGHYIAKSQRNVYIPNPSMARTKVVRAYNKRPNPYARPVGPAKNPRVGDSMFLSDAEMNRAYDAAMSAAAAANRASANVRTGGLIDKEVYFFDTSRSSIQIPATTTSAELDPNTGCTGCISAPAVGDSSSNRRGKKIMISSALVNCTVTRSGGSDQADAAPGISGVVCLVLDKQTNGAQLNSEDVYKEAGSSFATNALRNLQYSKRFTVLAVQKFYMPPTPCGTDGASTLSSAGDTQHFVLTRGLNLPVNFTTGTTADVANVVDNSLHVIAFASQAGSGINGVNLAYDARIRFVG